MAARPLALILALLVAAILAPAASASDAQNRVRASLLAAPTHTGPAATESPWTHPATTTAQLRLAAGCCVAAKPAASAPASRIVGNTTSAGVQRANPAEWRRLQSTWDDAGLGDILSSANRARIAKGRTPRVDDDWVRHFPGDEALIGERISMHHIGGSPFTVPLPATRHLDAHMPGGFRYNRGGPGRTG